MSPSSVLPQGRRQIEVLLLGCFQYPNFGWILLYLEGETTSSLEGGPRRVTTTKSANKSYFFLLFNFPASKKNNAFTEKLFSCGWLNRSLKVLK